MSRAPLERAAYTAFRSVPTRWSDNDQYGHVNNAVYYLYFDTAVNAFLSERCGEVRSLPALGVVAETSCRFLREAAFPDVLEVGLSLLRLGASSVTYAVGVFPEGGDEPHAVGRFVHVYVDPVTRRPTRVPDPVRAAVEPLHTDSSAS